MRIFGALMRWLETMGQPLQCTLAIATSDCARCLKSLLDDGYIIRQGGVRYDTAEGVAAFAEVLVTRSVKCWDIVARDAELESQYDVECLRADVVSGEVVMDIVLMGRRARTLIRACVYRGARTVCVSFPFGSLFEINGDTEWTSLLKSIGRVELRNVAEVPMSVCGSVSLHGKRVRFEIGSIHCSGDQVNAYLWMDCINEQFKQEMKRRKFKLLR